MYAQTYLVSKKNVLLPCTAVKSCDFGQLAGWGLDLLIKTFKVIKKDQVLQFFIQVIKESGTTFKQRLLRVRCVITTDARNVRAILSKNFRVVDYSLGLHVPTIRPLLGAGIFTQDGEVWKHSRRTLRPHLAVNSGRSFPEMQKCVQSLLNAIPSDGKIDLQPLFLKLTLETTMHLLFGDLTLAENKSQITKSEFEMSFTVAQKYLSYRGFLGPFYWKVNGGRFRHACHTRHKFIDTAIMQALEQNNQSRTDKHKNATNASLGEETLLGALMLETEDLQVLRDECLNVLLAGRDTTACCLQWAFRLLSQHQNILAKLRSEIDNVVGLGSAALCPTRQDLKKMLYLNNVIKEVLRLYPCVPTSTREALRLTALPVGGGVDGKSAVLVRPGEGVGYCVYTMHRRKDIYGPDAELFRPERWEGDDLKTIGWAYPPFNAGPRVCLGREFALLEVAYDRAYSPSFSQARSPPR